MNLLNIAKIEIRNNFNQHLFTASEFKYVPEEDSILIKDSVCNECIKRHQTLYLILDGIDGSRKLYKAFVIKQSENTAELKVIGTEAAVDLEERRRYIKVNTKLKILIRGIEKDGRLLKFATPVKSVITDINQGGIFINNSYPLHPGERICIDVRFNETVLRIKCEVLRAQSNIDRVVGYGCQFIGLSEEAEKAIKEFIIAEATSQLN